MLGERGQVDDAHGAAQSAALVAHVFEIIGAAETPLVARLDALRRHVAQRVATSPHWRRIELLGRFAP